MGKHTGAHKNPPSRAGTGSHKNKRAKPPKVVALGGGHGLAASLRALRLITDRLTAVVTVADDGGSSGRLREELGSLPPGDLRMALAALCDDSESGRTWEALLQHRFETNGPLDHHAVGNLMITGLWDELGDPVAGLETLGRLINARGKVLPMANVPLQVEADVRDDTGESRHIVGQKNVALAHGDIVGLELVPPDPPACPQSLAAVEAADWVVLGPGSWFTSVLIHLLVPGLHTALHETKARRLVTLNIAADEETTGYSAVEYLVELYHYGPDFRVDVVLADPESITDRAACERVAANLGAELVIRNVAKADGSAQHDPLLLAAAYRDIFAS